MPPKIDPARLAQLKEFVLLCRAQPAVLNNPELHFFREWMKSLGATIPEPKPAPQAEAKPDTQETQEPDTQEEEPAETRPPEEEPMREDTQAGEEPAAKEQPMREDAEATKEEPMDDEEDESSESEESAESDLELDMEGTISPDDDPPQQMGDASITITEEMEEKASTERSDGMMAAIDGDFEKALEHYTNAVLANPKSAPLYAKRASIFLKLKKPNAAIRDCDEALKLNENSAQGYKWRGRGYYLLGHWEEASKDLQQACKLDYDEDANDWLKEIKPKAQRIREHKLKQERRQRDREVKLRKKRIKEIQKAQERERREEEARRRQQSAGGRMPGGMGGMPFGMGGMPGGMGGMPGGMPGGMGGMPGGMGGMPGGMPGGMGGMPGGMPGGMGGAGGIPPEAAEMMSDPEIMMLFQDPEVVKAFQDIQSNPANINKYNDNPKVAKVIEKLAQKFGGAQGGKL